MKEAAPLAPTIAITAGDSVSGDAGDEDGAPIEDISASCSTVSSRVCNGRCQRLWGRGGR